MTTKRVPYIDLARQWEQERTDLIPLIDQELSRGNWVNGESVAEFEDAAARTCETRFAVALNSGTDALVLALACIGVKPGDEVITTPNSFIATTAAISHLGATPVFIDVLEDQSLDTRYLSEAVSPKTRAILPVHLTGRMCKMDEIRRVGDTHDIRVVEDAAQSVGSRYLDRPSGSWGDVGCFSTHPLKNLNALGDGGFVVTGNEAVAARIRRLRSHGLVDRSTAIDFGYVSRMDTLQATVLKYRLEKLPDVINIRRRHAQSYRDAFADLEIDLPPFTEHYLDTFHTFVIQTDHRDSLKDFLAEHGVGSAVHYPALIPDQPAMQSRPFRVVGDLAQARRQSQRILSLPIHQYLTASQVAFVIEKVRAFFGM
jgi:dTDP-4-amino-4,6-dideoxygalactose transaminase